MVAACWMTSSSLWRPELKGKKYNRRRRGEEEEEEEMEEPEEPRQAPSCSYISKGYLQQRYSYR